MSCTASLFRRVSCDTTPWRTAFAGAVALSVAMILGGCATTPATNAHEGPTTEAEAVAIESDYGVRIEGLHRTAAGSMLDLRYRVLDPDKAAPFLNGKIQPYIVDTARSAKLAVPDTPKLGRIRQTSRNNVVRANRSYFIMFGNPGKAIQSGDTVALYLGQVKVSDLTVQ